MSEQITITIPSDPAPRASILRIPSISHLTDSSSSSCDSKRLNISFAPLPKTEGKKRRNRRPIGLAGRAELLQISRQRLAEAMANEDNYYGNDYNSYEEEEDIPLPDIGKLVKGLWRSLSRIREKQSSREPTCESESPSREPEPDPKSKLDASSTPTPHPKPKAILHTVEKKSRSLPDTAEKAGPEIFPRETRSTSPSPPSQVAEDVSPIMQISSISTPPQQDLEVLPKSLDDSMQISVFNALKIETQLE